MIRSTQARQKNISFWSHLITKFLKIPHKFSRRNSPFMIWWMLIIDDLNANSKSVTHQLSSMRNPQISGIEESSIPTDSSPVTKRARYNPRRHVVSQVERELLHLSSCHRLVRMQMKNFHWGSSLSLSLHTRNSVPILYLMRGLFSFTKWQTGHRLICQGNKGSSFLIGEELKLIRTNTKTSLGGRMICGKLTEDWGNLED